jgi:hypothetical protein
MVMDILEIVLNMKAGNNEIAFILALSVVSFFYTAYKKCEDEIEKEKMLEQFLNE